MLIAFLKAPFKPPKDFPSKDFNPNGISLEDLRDYPRIKQTCWNVYDILSDVFFFPCY